MSRRVKQRSFAENLVLTSAGRLVGPLAALVTLPILARSLGVDGRGEVAAVTSPFLLASAAATIGLPDAVAYLSAKRPGVGGKLLARVRPYAVLAGLLASLLITLASDWLADGDEHLAHRIAVVSLASPLAIVVAIARGRAVGDRAWSRVRLEQILNALFSLAAISGLAILGLLERDSAVFAFVFSQIVGGVAYFRMRAVVPEPADEIPSTSSALSYGLRAWIGAVAGVAVSRLDQALLTGLSTAHDLGLYAVAASVSELPLAFSGVLSLMVFAHDAADEDNARLAKIARISSVVCAAFAAAICAAAPWVFPLVFGSGFSEAVPSTAILLLAIVCGVPGSVAGSALAARGHVGLRSWGLLVALMVNVVLLVWLAPRFGAVGAAAATLGANFVATVWALIFLRRREAVAIRTFIGVRRGDIELIWTKVDGRLRAARARDPQGGERE